jgi:hypothetical protein
MESNQFNQFAETGQYSLTEGSISSATVDVFVAKNITENDVPSTLPHVLTAEAITETNVEEATAIHNNDDENDTDSEEDEMSDVDSDLEDVLRDWEFQLADREADRALDCK